MPLIKEDVAYNCKRYTPCFSQTLTLEKVLDLLALPA